MTDVDFKFCKDQWGVHVYYSGKDGNPNVQVSNLMINDKVEFDSSKHCVVPPVRKVSTVDRITGDETVLTFKVEDIEYPADERLVPMRHLLGSPINYFTVNAGAVAIKMLHTLCQNAGLTNSRDGDARTYTMADYTGNDVADRIKIEGMHCNKPFQGVRLDQNFTGHIQECREFINDVEARAREAVDMWLLGGKTSKGFTVSFLIDHLEVIQRHVLCIQTKIKTANEHRWALDHIARAISEIKMIGMEELLSDEENSDDSLDNV